MKRLLVAAALAFHVLASLAGRAEPAKQEAEFAPRKPYRECLNRSFALLLILGRGGRSPEIIAEDALSACRSEERALAAIAEEFMPLVKDRKGMARIGRPHSREPVVVITPAPVNC